MDPAKRYSIVASVASVGLVSLLFWPNTPPIAPAIFRGREIELVSPDGQYLVRLAATNAGATIAVGRTDGQGSIALTSTSDTDQIRIGGFGARRESLSLGCDESRANGSSKSPGGATILFCDQTGSQLRQLTSE